MKKLTNLLISGVVACTFAGASIAASVSTASAADTAFNLSVPITTVKTGAVGSTHTLASQTVADQYRGMTCSINATAENQGSVHPGNNLVVASNGTSVTLADVERAGGVITHADGSLTLGPEITVSLVMGRDKIFSGGMDVNINCVEPEIEVCRDNKIITIKQSERRESDTNLPCPAPEFNANIVCSVENNAAVYKLKINQTSDHKDVKYSPANGTVLQNGESVEVIAAYEDGRKSRSVTKTAERAADCTPDKVEVCRDGKVISIFESERKDTDTVAPCPVPEIKVCRDGKVVTIKETDKKSSDTAAPCEVKGTTTVLPNTGAGSIAGLVGATFASGTAIAQLRMRRIANRS